VSIFDSGAAPSKFPPFLGEFDIAHGGFEPFDARRYGLIVGSTADQVTALEDGIAEVNAATVVRANVVGDVGAYSASIPVLMLPPGFYAISHRLILGGYTSVVGRNVFIKMLDPTEPIFDSDVSGAGFLNVIGGIHFIGGAQHLRIVRGNSDTGMVAIFGCSHSDADPTKWAVELQTQSGRVDIVRPRILDAPQFLKATDVDQLTLSKAWVNGYAQATGKKPADTSSFQLARVAGTNQRTFVTDCLFVPEPEGTPPNANTRWFDLDDYNDLVIDRCQFGGENGGFPVVYNNSSAAIPAGSAYPQGGGITILNSQISSGASSRTDRGAVVLRTAVPNRIVVTNCSVLEDGYVINDTIAGGAAAWIAANTDAQHPRINVEISGVMGAGVTPIGRDVGGVQTAITDLDPFAIVRNPSTVGGLDAMALPGLVARTHLFAPARTHAEVTADATSGNGFLATDEGNGWLAFNTQAKQYFLTGPKVPNANGLAVPVAALRSVAANVAADFTDRTILVDTTAAGRTITLPSVVTVGQRITVKIIAGANNCVVQAASGNVEGTATKTWGAVLVGYEFEWDGTDWWIVGKAVG
jgi:hypothetical protein